MKKTIRRYHKTNHERTFANVECPFCNYDLAYLNWLQFDTIGYCYECHSNWAEGGGGMICKLQ